MDENYVDNNDHKWILCANCNNWFHIYCVLLSDEQYEEIIQKNEKWFCQNNKCIEKSLSIESSTDKDQPLKCNECKFIAKNVRGLKIHSHVHKKGKSNHNLTV